MAQSKTPGTSFVEIIVSFVIPTIILLRFSSESQLGPAKAMLLALAFPVALELYRLSKRQKPSVLSMIAIGGILVTGVISLLGLNENWLALRRSLVYFVIAAALLISILIKRPLLDMALPHIIDMDTIVAAARKKSALPALKKHLRRTTYMIIVLLVAIGIASYVLTLIVITAPTNTAEFNNEYVRLRVIGLPAITLPLLAGIFGILLYFVSKIEKLTGLDASTLFKKK
jgi:intracellular septation protein A